VPLRLEVSTKETYREILVEALPENEDVRAAVRDVGAVHQRLAPGFVVDVRLDEDARVVTFANGAVVRELIVDIDDDTARRRLVWIADVLPDDVAGRLSAPSSSTGQAS
jgi:hypothetical protein